MGWLRPSTAGLQALDAPVALSRSAPPVAVDLGPEPAWRAGCMLLWALAAGAGALWQGQRWGLAPEPAVWGVCLGLALVSGWAGWHGASAPLARLEWTGREWRLRHRTPSSARAGRREDVNAPGDLADTDLGAEQACAPEVMIDLGPWMLLRLGGSGQSPRGLSSAGWVAVSRRHVGVSWHGLRVALYGAPQAQSEG